MTISERIYIYTLISSRVRPTLCQCWGQVSLKIEETIAKLVRESIFCFINVILSFCTYPSLGSEPSSYDHAFGLLASPTSLEPPHVARVWSRGQLVFVIVIPQAFFLIKTEGLSRATFFLDG